jgi:hypothetical protein
VDQGANGEWRREAAGLEDFDRNLGTPGEFFVAGQENGGPELDRRRQVQCVRRLERKLRAQVGGFSTTALVNSVM